MFPNGLIGSIEVDETLVDAIAALVCTFAFGMVVIVVYRLFSSRFTGNMLITFFRVTDRFLIERVAPVTGIRKPSAMQRWALLLAWFLLWTLIAVFAPYWYGMWATILGVLSVLAIYRAWKKDETGRRLRETQNKATSDKSDLSNELLLGLIFLMAFFTIGFSRLGEVEASLKGDAIIPYAQSTAFVGGELLMALPIIDVSEVFDWNNPSGLAPGGPIGKLLQLALRVFLDLVILTTLFQILDIIRRQRTGEDLREIRRIIRDGEPSRRVDEALTQLTCFARHGSLNAQREIEFLIQDAATGSSVYTFPRLSELSFELSGLANKFGVSRFRLSAIIALEKADRARTTSSSPHQRAETLAKLSALMQQFADSFDVPELIRQAYTKEAAKIADESNALYGGMAPVHAQLIFLSSKAQHARLQQNTELLQKTEKCLFNLIKEMRRLKSSTSLVLEATNLLAVVNEALFSMTGDAKSLERATDILNICRSTCDPKTFPDDYFVFGLNYAKLVIKKWESADTWPDRQEIDKLEANLKMIMRHAQLSHRSHVRHECLLYQVRLDVFVASKAENYNEIFETAAQRLSRAIKKLDGTTNEFWHQESLLRLAQLNLRWGIRLSEHNDDHQLTNEILVRFRRSAAGYGDALRIDRRHSFDPGLLYDYQHAAEAHRRLGEATRDVEALATAELLFTGLLEHYKMRGRPEDIVGAKLKLARCYRNKAEAGRSELRADHYEKAFLLLGDAVVSSLAEDLDSPFGEHGPDMMKELRAVVDAMPPRAHGNDYQILKINLDRRRYSKDKAVRKQLAESLSPMIGNLRQSRSNSPQ
ncbi:hypothetical protein [Hyphomonas sp.]|uniref:hypothetical protein n=1 Tax=Hyphomonas sp. TaxID=87 RepID=UPI0025B9931A|nr:hypothetical protein [Hyphomonas sp.]